MLCLGNKRMYRPGTLTMLECRFNKTTHHIYPSILENPSQHGLRRSYGTTGPLLSSLASSSFPLFKAPAFAFRSFTLLIRIPSAFAPLGNKRHHHLFLSLLLLPWRPLTQSLLADDRAIILLASCRGGR